MKYTAKTNGKITYDVKATDNVTGVITNLWKKISGIISNSKEDTSTQKVEKPEGGLIAGGVFEWNVEANLDITVEEMTELFKISKENDLHAWDLLKTAGKDLVKGSRVLLNEFKAQGPEWMDAVHSMDLISEDQEKERELHKFRNERELDAEIKKAGWTRKGSFWYENETEGRKTSVHFNTFKKDKKDEPHKGSFDNLKDED